MTATVKIRRLAYALGAEVTGIDLSKDLSSDTLLDIRKAWLAHQLLRFPDQKLSESELLTFVKSFAAQKPVRPDERITTLSRSDDSTAGRWDGYKDGHNWHSDKSFTANPTEATMLYCRSTPAVGGDTVFANMYTAFDSLSATMKGILEGLSAIHVRQLALRPLYKMTNGVDNLREQIEATELSNAATSSTAIHPAVLIHGETNRKALFLGSRVRQFVGMTEEESRPLIDFLNRHAVSYEFTYRHSWSVNDLVMWDNRCLLHIALCDYDVEHDCRHMLRCVIPRQGAHDQVLTDETAK